MWIWDWLFLDDVGLVWFPQQGKKWHMSQILSSWTLFYFPTFLFFLHLEVLVLSDKKEESRIFFLYKEALITLDELVS